MYKTIIFDIDGTLLDSEEVLLSSLKKALYEVLKISYPLHELRNFIGVNENDVVAMLTNDPQEQKVIKNLWTYFVEHHPLPPKLFPDVISTLTALKLKGVTLGIVTSKTKEHMKHDFDKTNLHHFFDFIITSDDVIHPKPHPEPLITALEISKSQNETTLYIGDTYTDLMCAKQAGIPFALAAWGAKEDQRLTQADFILEIFYDIVSIKPQKETSRLI